ncbi:MAG: hypothetical protein GWN00_05115 [Aliifodinibius sp.]|nr:hypothetical protein [Fodinibius sp.]NIV10581.1 hypothetical protein [Fodinibius sp.]NIY24209.1 hypothetical protein [Fodinibius sp.]
MKTKVCILSACLFVFLIYTGLTPKTERLENNKVIELDEHALDGVTGGAIDMVCWDHCPKDAGETCPEGEDCTEIVECPGAEWEKEFEATKCVTSNNNQHICNAGTEEEVKCTNGWICFCWNETKVCTMYICPPSSILSVMKDC